MFAVNASPDPSGKAPRSRADDEPLSFIELLVEEQASFEALCASLSHDDWDRATPAAGWSVRDQVSHLADTEELAHDTATGGPRSLAAEIERHNEDGGVIEFGVGTGRSLGSGEEVLDWWRRASRRNREALSQLDPSTRVPWGLGMKWRSFVTARTMEHWAHALDIASAVGVAYPDTGRLRHVGHLCYSSLPYAFNVAEVTPPPYRSLKVVLDAPTGEVWEYGPGDATDVIRGPAGVWCRRAVQRISPAEAASQLDVDGPLAQLALQHARAFL